MIQLRNMPSEFEDGADIILTLIKNKRFENSDFPFTVFPVRYCAVGDPDKEWVPIMSDCAVI